MSGFLCGALIAIGAPVYYLTSCIFWPYTRCWRCKGDAKHSAWWGGGFQMCSRCDGTGRRLKLGRAIYNYVSSKGKAAR